MDPTTNIPSAAVPKKHLSPTWIILIIIFGVIPAIIVIVAIFALGSHLMWLASIKDNHGTILDSVHASNQRSNYSGTFYSVENDAYRIAALCPSGKRVFLDKANTELVALDDVTSVLGNPNFIANTQDSEFEYFNEETYLFWNFDDSYIYFAVSEDTFLPTGVVERHVKSNWLVSCPKDEIVASQIIDRIAEIENDRPSNWTAYGSLEF